MHHSLTVLEIEDDASYRREQPKTMHPLPIQAIDLFETNRNVSLTTSQSVSLSVSFSLNTSLILSVNLQLGGLKMNEAEVLFQAFI